jgi:hypothetical protein
MPEPRKMAHDRLLELVRPAAKDALAAVPEAESVILVTPWAMGLNYPPGLIITREGQIDISGLFQAKAQLMRMIDLIDRQIFGAVQQKVSHEDAARDNASSSGQPG